MAEHPTARQNSVAFAFIVAGFVLLDVWCDLLGHSAATAVAAQTVQDSFANARMVWNISLVAWCAAMVAAPRALTSVRRVLDIAFPLIAIPFTLLYSFAGSLGAAVPLLCIVVTGIAYGWLEIRLFCEAAQLPSITHIVAAVVGSRALKAVLVACAGVLPVFAQAAVDVACVLLCGVCLVCASRRNGAKVFERPVASRLPESDRILVVVLVALYPALNAVARALSPLGLWGDGSIVGATSIVPIAVGAAAFLLACFAVFRRCDDASVFNRMAAALVVLLGALLVADNVALPLLADAPAARGVSMGIELFSHSLFWLAGIFAVRMAPWPALRLAAATELVMSSVAVLLGIALQASAGIGQGIVALALYAVMAVLVFVVWRFREQLSSQAARAAAETGRLSGQAASETAADELEAACARLAAECGLTPRETEVFQLLAQGRSRPYIQEKLVISDATVKTHCTHVYQKLGVANKQQLIEKVRSR